MLRLSAEPVAGAESVFVHGQRIASGARDAANRQAFDLMSLKKAGCSIRTNALSRMLRNLKGVYAKKEQWAKALAVLNLLVEAYPNAPEEIRMRGVVQLRLKRFRGARADLPRPVVQWN